MTKYGKLTPELLKELIGIAGTGNVITEMTDMEGYASDEIPMAQRYYPQVVLKPDNEKAVAAILKVAHKHVIPVTPRGAGTGVSGGCTPVHGGIVLSLEKFNKILEIDRSNFVAVVEPGVTLEKLKECVEQHGFYYPVYPGELSATIGGNIATNAGGMNAVKYGVTRHQVLGVVAILPDGKVIRSGGKFVKSSSGYDLSQLLIGSEGTLAVVTKIILKLTILPYQSEVLLVPFENLQAAIGAVPEILKLDMIPDGLEFFGRDIVEILENHTGKEMPYHQYAAFLMLVVNGESADIIHDYFTRVEKICRENGAVVAMVPDSQRARRRLIEAREKFYPAIKSYARMEIIDAVVPRSEIARFVKQVDKIAHELGIKVIAYGHAGDGNVHIHLISSREEESLWERNIKEAMHKIYAACIAFGGAVSGEHGIGFAKKPYLAMQLTPVELRIMRGIKKEFDPKNILNPGKIFD